MSITGPFGAFVAFFACWFLGDLLDRGIIVLDITLDKLKEGLKDEQWKSFALEAYKKASSGAKTLEEKNAIRKQYQDALTKYATIGNGLPNGQNP